MGETFDRINRAFKDTADKTADSADKVADPQTYTNPNKVNENRDYERRGKEPVNPDAIQNMNQLRSRETRTQALQVLQVTEFNLIIFKI